MNYKIYNQDEQANPLDLNIASASHPIDHPNYCRNRRKLVLKLLINEAGRGFTKIGKLLTHPLRKLKFM
ncbi:hypothetical protein [Aquibacillus kalidii]|uniref:hypothetical protein n=1 Tax=Aquibacillus kalidii TaxID=2762597 RepID=UPI001C99DB6E|nr:hypothetical protein [Aquibacillus kalidii]